MPLAIRCILQIVNTSWYMGISQISSLHAETQDDLVFTSSVTDLMIPGWDLKAPEMEDICDI